MSATSLWITGRPAIIDLHIASNGPPKFLQPLQECSNAGLPFSIARGEVHEDTNAPRSVRLLRPRRERPRRRAAEERDELAAPDHSITSSARTRNVSGMVSPIALAALRLITKSNFVGCSMGSSAGLAPLNILSTYVAARR